MKETSGAGSAGKKLIIVPDTSVIIDGRITKLIRKSRARIKVVVPEAVVSELENQANQGRESGFSGLEELERLKRYRESRKIELEFYGRRPGITQLKDIDEMIRKSAQELKAVFVTSDKVQAKVASAKGINVHYLRHKRVKRKLRIIEFFTKDTMSVHLKENTTPLAKVGKPGDIKLVKISNAPIRKQQIQRIALEIIEFAKIDPESFIEIERKGATVVQLRNIRICIARPPFSDGYEITAVRPIAHVTLQDYRLSEKLIKRLSEKAEGVFIAGPPGAGKSTFAQALAEFYRSRGKIVKTMESPRDLMVSDEITQYSPLEGSMEKTADILLLVRPDYTIYDEVRKTADFNIFADMRLSGVGMAGVIHATRAIDAIQRMLKRVELGMVPQIIDTVIFIKDGEIKNVYSLELTVKVPYGMLDEELSRPVIDVKDFETEKVEYEIYSFGEEIIVMPVKEEKKTGALKLAEERIVEKLEKMFPRAEIKAELKGNRANIFVSEKYIPAVIGKGGERVEKLEKELGIKMQIKPIEEFSEFSEETAKKEQPSKKEADFSIEDSERHIRFIFGSESMGKNIALYIDSELLLFATVGRKGDIKINKHSDIGNKILAAISGKKEIKAVSES